MNILSTGKYEAPYSEYPQLKIDYQIFFHVAKKQYRPTLPQGTPTLLAGKSEGNSNN